MKRTFQVAIFGASDTANQRVLVSLRRARGGDLVAIPDWAMGTTTRFFDYDTAADSSLQARFRIRAVSADDLVSQAFLGVIRVQAVVFVPSGAHDASAWRELQEHFATYGTAPVIVASSRLVRGVKGVLAPPSGPALAAAMEREVISSFHSGDVKGWPTTTPSKAYQTRANALAEAAQIAIAVGPRSMRRFHESMRTMALHPELGFATTSSLASLETAFFTSWNEGIGAHVDRFWREVVRRRLPFERRDVIGEVLARGRITSRGDYETVTDLHMDERLTAKQRARLGAMLGQYEAASSRRQSRGPQRRPKPRTN